LFAGRKKDKKMTNLEKLEIAARRAHYAPSAKSGNWEAEKSDGTGTCGLGKGEFGVWGYKDDGGPMELIGWGKTKAAACAHAAARLNAESDADEKEDANA